MHLTETQLENFVAQRLTAEELFTLTQHLSACAACRQRVSLRQPALYPALHNALLAESEPVHLTFEQLADWVDGRRDEPAQQFAADHVSHCQQCHAAAADLRAFGQQVANQLAVEIKPQALAQPSFNERLRAFFANAQWTWATASAAFIALLVLGLLGWRVWRQPAPQQEIAVTASPTVTPTAAPTATLAPAPAALLAQLNDAGQQLALDAQGKLQGADAWPERYRQLAQSTLQTNAMPRSAALNGLGSASAALMGQGKESGFALLEPVRKVVLADRPVLRWQPLAGATSYQVELVSEQYEPIAQSETLTATSWQVPQALARGRVYAWQVKASKGGEIIKSPQPPAPLARFRVVAQTDYAEIQAARSLSSHLLLGQLYAQAGLLKEAEREFLALQKANPTAALPKKLLAGIRQQAAQ